jgi:hypothetical protein
MQARLETPFGVSLACSGNLFPRGEPLKTTKQKERISMKKTSPNGPGGVATLARSRLKTIQYYDVPRYWTNRIVPHLGDAELNRVLTSDMDRYASWPFLPVDYPDYCEAVDWRLDHHGREPRFWRYVCAGACHFLVNFALRLASLVEPDQPWRIVTSRGHSTVWNGADQLFEFNYLANLCARVF